MPSSSDLSEKQEESQFISAKKTFVVVGTPILVVAGAMYWNLIAPILTPLFK